MSKQQREASRRERVAEMQREVASRDRRRKLLLSLAIVVVLGAVVAGFVIFSGGGGTTGTPAATPPAKASGQALVVGSNDEAKYKVVVYEDFLCPYCREFESSSRDFLRADAQKGTVQIEYRPFHLLRDDYSSRALSAWAAVLQEGTGKQALRFHDLLFDNQPYESDSDKPDASDLADLAEKAGVSDDSILASARKADDTFVDAADASAKKAGVTGTPTVMVNGTAVEGTSISSLVDNLERMVAAG